MLIELDAWKQNSKFKPKASLHKGGGLRPSTGNLRPPINDGYLKKMKSVNHKNMDGPFFQIL